MLHSTIKFIKSEKGRIIAVMLALYDAAAVCLAYLIALYISYECARDHIPPGMLNGYCRSIPYVLAACLPLYWRCGFYRGIWRFVEFRDAVAYSLAVSGLACGYFLLAQLWTLNLPRRYFAIGWALQLAALILSRFFCRLVIMLVIRIRNWNADGESKRRCMMIGAGAAAHIIIRDITVSLEERIKVCCIIDDDPNLRGCHVAGVPVVGDRDDIMANVEKYRIEEILFAIPSIGAKAKRDILNICKLTGCKIRVLPGVCQLVDGKVSLSRMNDVTMEDLLGRAPVKVNNEEILDHLSGKVVLVTGGGGSIGGELCRQIAAHRPGQLVIFDIYENGAYGIQQELKRKYPRLKLLVLIGTVREAGRVRQIFAAHRPEIVFHAAAHKHVPLMEDNPCEAIKNNVLGTWNTACAALESGCRKFVLISTDKAVNPTNIMGASKRLCEIIIQIMAQICRDGKYDLLKQYAVPPGGNTRTDFVAVRFGNVLNSNGSVVPLFRRQIENGGPVTVTHPDIIRYFMTIPEAVSLVLQTAAYADGGNIFVLDMGEPVKIDTLARNLIKLSGYQPDVDIKIEYSGLRPGEKLYEEKLLREEGLSKTPNKLIYIAKPPKWEVEKFLASLEQLIRISRRNEDGIFETVAKLVPTFKHECRGQGNV